MRTTNGNRWIAATATIAALVACGCRRSEPVVLLQHTQPLEWDAISLAPAGAAADGYRILLSERTTGVFPASLLVARVSAESNHVGEATVEMLTLNTEPEVDFLAWNSVFDDLRDISEVFPLKEEAMNGAPTSVDTILNAADALNAGLCLIYAECDCSVYDFDVRGALYEVKPRRQLAALHAMAHVDYPVGLDEDLDEDETEEDREARDPRLLAVDAFENHARACLRDLQANDDPVPPTAPEGWIPDRPIEPIIWPPLDERWYRRP